MLCPLNRVLVTDGKLLYNCSDFKELRGNDIKTELPEIAVVGVIGEQKDIIIPTKFCGKKVKLIHSLNVYRKGSMFSEIKGDFALIPSTVRKDINFYYPCERLVPEPEYLVNTDRTTAEKVSFDGIAFEKSVFHANRKIKSITFGTGKVSSESFMNCEALETVELTERVRVIGKKAFSGCSSLEFVALPSKLRKIGSDAFASTGLRYIAIPSAVEAIMPNTFRNCKKLEMIFIPPTVKSISISAFDGVDSDMTIIGISGSAAEVYAQKYKFRFVEYDDSLREKMKLVSSLYNSVKK